MPQPDIKRLREKIEQKIEEVTKEQLEKISDWDMELLRVVRGTLSSEMKELGEKLREETRENIRRFVGENLRRFTDEHTARLQQLLVHSAPPNPSSKVGLGLGMPVRRASPTSPTANLSLPPIPQEPEPQPPVDQTLSLVVSPASPLQLGQGQRQEPPSLMPPEPLTVDRLRARGATVEPRPQQAALPQERFSSESEECSRVPSGPGTQCRILSPAPSPGLGPGPVFEHVLSHRASSKSLRLPGSASEDEEMPRRDRRSQTTPSASRCLVEDEELQRRERRTDSMLTPARASIAALSRVSPSATSEKQSMSMTFSASEKPRRRTLVGKQMEKHMKPSQRAYAKWQRSQRRRRSSSISPTSALVLEKVGRHHGTVREERKPLMFRLKAAFAQTVESDYFDYTISALLVLNALVIGVQADYMIDRAYEVPEVPLFFQVLNKFFCVVFFLELAIRLTVDRLRFWSWYNETWKWNWFDTMNVTLAVVEEFVVPWFGSEMMDVAAGTGVVRALRICRVARLVRMVRLIPELKSMVYLVLASASSFVWTCILMCILMYCYAVYFTELVTEMVIEDPDRDLSNVLRYWGSIERSMLTLYQAMTGGGSWHIFIDVFQDIGSGFWFNAIFFSVYIAFTTLVVLNLVTGVFVEGAQRIMSEEREEALINMASKVFIDADLDCSACLDKSEFESLLESSLMDDFLRESGLQKTDAGRLFHVFDEDGSGDLTLMEFVAGCLRMNASAKATDVAEMRYEIRVMSEQLFKCFGAVEEAVLTLNDRYAAASGTQADSVLNKGRSARFPAPSWHPEVVFNRSGSGSTQHESGVDDWD